MSRSENTVVYLHRLDPAAALERLKRVTGLQFASWPESLRPQVGEAEAMAGEGVKAEAGPSSRRRPG